MNKKIFGIIVSILFIFTSISIVCNAQTKGNILKINDNFLKNSCGINSPPVMVSYGGNPYPKFYETGEYDASARDLDNDSFKIFIDYDYPGAIESSDWLSNDEQYITHHKFPEQGWYNISWYAQDEHGAVSEKVTFRVVCNKHKTDVDGRYWFVFMSGTVNEFFEEVDNYIISGRAGIMTVQPFFKFGKQFYIGHNQNTSLFSAYYYVHLNKASQVDERYRNIFALYVDIG